MKKTSLIIAAFVLVTGLVVFGTYAVADKFLARKTIDTECVLSGKKHTATIQNGVISPANTIAKRCDSLTIINKDTKPREIAFGQHDRHVVYDGVTERILKQNESFTVTLKKTGTFLFHDHLQDETAGTMTIHP